MPTITYQLKYCERCGSLRLRPAHSAENYCQPCEQALFHWSLPEDSVRLLLRRPGQAPVVEPVGGPPSPPAKFEPHGGRLSPPAISRAPARDLNSAPNGRLQ